MNKAENYLYERLDLLSDEKMILFTKVNEIDLEMEEMQLRLKELEDSVDDAYEVFSPRSKKNDFTKGEIDLLKKKMDEMNQLKEEYNSHINLVSEDMALIRDALGQEEEEESVYISDPPEKEESIDGVNILFDFESERKRIARELHDSIVQVLTNLVHKCEICSKVMDVDIVRSKLELEVMSKTLRDTIADLRNVIYNLRPMSMDDIGLEVTIANFLSQIEKTTDIEIKWEVRGEKYPLAEIEKLSLIRVLQESTRNSVKHSLCDKIYVELVYDTDSIRLRVRDNGKGFDINNLKKPIENDMTGFGIMMMKERISLLKGNFELYTDIGKGTEIIVSINTKK